MLERRPVDVNELIQQVVREITPVLEKQGKNLSIEASTSLHVPLVWADALRLRQVLLNLLSNAIKFVDKGLIHVQAQTGKNGSVVVSVQDEGIGISAEQQLIIFEKFRQGNGSLARNAGGTGLGLAICKQLVELHGGHIWVDSVPSITAQG